MLETPDAAPGDVEDGAADGPDDGGPVAPPNPAGRTFAEAQDDDLPVLEEPRAVFFDQYGDADADADEPAFVAVDPPEGMVAEAEAVEVPEAVADEEAHAEPDAQPEAEAESEPDAEPEGGAEAEPDARPDAQPDTEAEAEPDAQPEAEAEPDAEPDTQPDSEAEAVEVPEALAPAEPEPPAEPTVSELQAELAALTATLAKTERRADELMVVARRQTEMADELHAENRRLREGEIREAVAPLVRGLARLADTIGRIRATDAAATGTDLDLIERQVGELLHDAGVTPLLAERGDLFDPQLHQATGSATTDITALHRTVAEVRRSGLRRDDGRMLRPVDVVVFRYVAPAPPLDDIQAATEEVT